MNTSFQAGALGLPALVDSLPEHVVRAVAVTHREATQVDVLLATHRVRSVAMGAGSVEHFLAGGDEVRGGGGGAGATSNSPVPSPAGLPGSRAPTSAFAVWLGAAAGVDAGVA